jgi:hypothetical protein
MRVTSNPFTRFATSRSCLPTSGWLTRGRAVTAMMTAVHDREQLRIADGRRFRQ